MEKSLVVEGEWGDFRFRMLSEADIPEVCKHLREHFVPDEPVSAKIGQSDVKNEEYCKAICNQLNSNMCFAAFEKKSGKMVAIRTITRRNIGDPFISLNFESSDLRTTVQFFTQVENKCNVFETYGITEYADLRVQSVDREFRGRGLATEMYKRALDFLRKSGFVVAKSVFTSPYTRKAATKFGFIELARENFSEIRDENGRLVCPDADDSEFVAVMALKLK